MPFGDLWTFAQVGSNGSKRGKGEKVHWRLRADKRHIRQKAVCDRIWNA